jgi:hypothetical protein
VDQTKGGPKGIPALEGTLEPRGFFFPKRSGGHYKAQPFLGE